MFSPPSLILTANLSLKRLPYFNDHRTNNPAIGPNGCIMAVIASSGETDVHDSSTSYDLWQAFVTVKAMCVRRGQVGKISVGLSRKLTMGVFPYG